MSSEQVAERAVLGGILLDHEQIYHCANLKPSDFSLSSHRTIFRTMYGLAIEGKPADLVTVVTELERCRTLESIGGVGYLSGLVDEFCTGRDISHYSDIVADSARRRQLVALCNATAAQCEDGSESTADCLSLAVDRILDLAGDGGQTKSMRVSEYSFDVFNKVKLLSKTPLSDLPVGLPTGVAGVDNITTGIREGEMWIIASFTGEGKTVLATQAVMESARRDIPCLWFTQEMSRRQVMLRMIPSLTNGVVKGRHLRDPRHMTAGQLMTFEKTQAIIDAWPVWINDAASIEIGQLFAHAMAMVKRHKIKLIVVDYLQLVKGRGDSRYERVTDVSNSLRELAKMTGVPIIAVSQMSKPENREKRPPRIFDLKESGSIEQDAHVILMPYRPQDKEGHYLGGDLIIVGKQREGPTGSIKVRFDSLTLTFEDMEDLSGATNQMF